MTPQAANNGPVLPFDVMMIAARFMKGRPLMNLGQTCKTLLTRTDLVWKEIFIKENGGYCPDNVTSWRCLCASNYIQRLNFPKMRTKENIPSHAVKANAFAFINRQPYKIKDGCLACLDDGTPDFIPMPRTEQFCIRQIDSSLVVTYHTAKDCFRDSLIISRQGSLTLWKNRTPLITVEEEGCYSFETNLMICKYINSNFSQLVTSEEERSDFTFWELDKEFKKTKIKMPFNSFYLGRVANHVYAYNRYEGFLVYNLCDPTQLAKYKFPEGFTFKTLEEVFHQSNENFLLCGDHQSNYWIFSLTDNFNYYKVGSSLTKPHLQVNTVFTYNLSSTDNKMSIICFDLMTKQILRTYPIEDQASLKSIMVDGNRVVALAERKIIVYDRDSANWIFSLEENNVIGKVSILSGIIHYQDDEQIRLHLHTLADGEGLKMFVGGNGAYISGDGYIYDHKLCTLQNYLYVPPNPLYLQVAKKAAEFISDVGDSIFQMLKPAFKNT